jgi:flagellin
MSGIVLSASVRQNLLSLQSTADLLAQTQNRLASGKKVNSALDNPTNFFTAAGLDSRASDINNLLDGIGNGVQILQAANTGITSLQKLVDTAKSIANQALQSTVGYSTKSNVSTTIAGATADDLRGTTTFATATAASNVVYSGSAGGTTPSTALTTLGGGASSLVGGTTVVPAAANANGTPGTVLNTGGTTATAAGTTLISALTNSTVNTPNGPVAGNSITVNGKTITFVATGTPVSDSSGNYTIGVDQNVNSLLATIDTINGNTTSPSQVVNGSVVLHSGTNSDLHVSDSQSGAILAKLGIQANNASNVPLGTSGTAQISAATKLYNTVGGLTSTAISDGDVMTVNGKTITFRAAAPPSGAAIPGGFGVVGNVATDGNGNSIIYIGTSTTTTNVTEAIDLASGTRTATVSGGAATVATTSGQTASSIAGGVVTLRSSTGSDLSVSGQADLLHELGLTAATGGSVATLQAPRSTSGSTIGTLIQAGSSLTVDGKTISFVDETVPAPSAVAAGSGVTGNIVTDSNGNSKVYLRSANLGDVLNAIDLATGTQVTSNVGGTAALTTPAGDIKSSVNSSGTLNISTGVASDLAISGTGNALSALGLAGNTGSSTVFTATRGAGPGGISGTSLTFTSFKGGTPVNVTFGDGTNGTVKTLAQLNNALVANNEIATLDANGVLTISAGNDYASSTLGSSIDGGAIGGTVTSALTFTTAVPPVPDLTSQAARANLVSQYNNVIAQITTTSQDASFNGVNLLAGDTLKLVFNETGKSTLSITGTQLTPVGLGLPTLTAGTDFIDNASANKQLAALNVASTTLRSQASALGSNLSIVQIRQDFAKNLINVLQTGSSNLTLADTNEEAANSQALSTRQSIAVSALALANQSQQSVLKLLQ